MKKQSESLKDNHIEPDRRKSSRMSSVSSTMKERFHSAKDLFNTPEIRTLTFKMGYLYFAGFAIYYASFMINIEGFCLFYLHNP